MANKFTPGRTPIRSGTLPIGTRKKESDSSPSLSLDRTSSVPIKSNQSINLISGHPHWIIEHPAEGTQPPHIQSELDEDVYTNEFATQPHCVFFSTKGGTVESIVAIQKNPDPHSPFRNSAVNVGPCFKAVNFTKKSNETFHIPYCLSKCGADPTNEFNDYLNKHPIAKDVSFYPASGPGIVADLMKIEKKHSLRVDKMKVAVLYVTKGQTDIKEIFANKPAEGNRFWSFMDSIATKKDMKLWTGYRGDMGKSGTDVDNPSYYTEFHGIPIMFHLAPYMDSEQHRRLIGNDIAVIIYYDCDDIHTPFVPFGSVDMGQVPHVFSVVQPVEGGHRLGFFNRPNVGEFGPASPPLTFAFDIDHLKSYLLTKLQNGYSKARDCPLLRTLFTKPRGEAIKDLGDQYSKGGATSPKPSEKNISSSSTKSLKVTVHSGKGLASKDSNGLSDPYIVVQINNSKKKTKIIFKTLEPDWNESFQFDVAGLDENANDILLTVYDHDDLGGDDYMGSVFVLLKTAYNTKEQKSYDLFSVTGEHVSGSINVSFETS
eukprot:TRINITY_DN4003_c0_g1_i1.p1 TRINITY_DN4003_c0_g1~~TRINITY_DN4003_c0_g1_i1.p1  ORF type:complete len:543 (+),score=153.70 TRINITY_DN4003_c0_g1_i1:56-1684(+)